MSLASRFDEPEWAPIAVDWNLGFSRAPTRNGLIYWRSLLCARAMPERHDLEPRAMARFLAHVNLVEAQPHGRSAWNYLATLQGSHLREMLGPVAGPSLPEIFPSMVASRWRSAFDLVRSSGVPLRIVTDESIGGRNQLACEALVAPLGKGRDVSALFWVFAAWRGGKSAIPEKNSQQVLDIGADAR